MDKTIVINSIRWDITNLCNLRCMHCYTLENHGKELYFSDVLRIISKLLPFGLREINFSGREPTLRQDLVSIIKWCVKKDISVNVTTNGTVLDHKGYEELCESGLNIMVFSLDGITEKVHDKIRGSGSFHKTIQNIEYCTKYLARLNLNTKIGISYTLQKTNVHEIGGLIDRCSSLGINFLAVNPVSICGRASQVKELLYLSSSDILKSWENICKKFSETKPNFELYLGTFPMEAKLLNIKYKLELPVIHTGCSAGKTIYIDPYGNALPCYMLPPVADSITELKKYLHYWRILDEPFSKIHEHFNLFITFASNHSQKNNRGCRNCPDIDVCRRCPLIAISDSEAIHRCQIAQKQIGSLSIPNNKSIIPAIKDCVTWKIADTILSVYLKQGDFVAEKRFEITPFVKSVLNAINGFSSLDKIEKSVKTECLDWSPRKIAKEIHRTIEYFWKEGIIYIK